MVIHFEDQGQKFSSWTIDSDGVIIKTSPKKLDQYIGSKVLKPNRLKKGDKVDYMSDDNTFSTSIRVSEIEIPAKVKRKKSSKNYGIKDMMSWNFEPIAFSQEWAEHLGELCTGFRMLIKGDPKNGKTEYMITLIKELATVNGKVNFNSTEQGKSPSLKRALLRNNIDQIPAGKFILCDASQRTFDAWFKRLKSPNSGKTIILDSGDYMNLTFAQYKQLIEEFPQKNIIIVCWLVNPLIKHLAHTMDIVVEVKDFIARPVGRLGGDKNRVIWAKRLQGKPQTTLF